MEEKQSLPELENIYSNTCETYAKASQRADRAKEKKESARKALDEALCSCAFGVPSEENQKKAAEADRAFRAAEAEEKAAEKAMEAAADEAQKALDAVEAGKEAARKSAYRDTAYVVHAARIECTCGMRESYLVLGPTHGVLARQIPQMTVTDTKTDTKTDPGGSREQDMNIINFGGCTSRENPTLLAAAEKAAEEARRRIEEDAGWGGKIADKIASWFCKDSSIQVTDSLLAECMGECIPCFPEDAEWSRGHEKVFINGAAVMLRRCTLRCNYGGLITILLSGQPE